MGMQTPVREERQTRMRPEVTDAPVTVTGHSDVVKRGRDAAGRRTRPNVGTVVMGVTTLMSLGALLGARFIGRRVMRRGHTRVKGGSPTIVVMFPFTAINLYGRRPRPLNLPLPLSRVQDRMRRFQRVKAAK